MRTSRIAREAAKIVDKVSLTDVINKKQTRSFAKSLHTFTANGASTLNTEELAVKQEDCSDNESPLSSLSSQSVLDIEDLQIPQSRKRKRETVTPPITVTRTSPRPITQSPSSKTHIAIEDGQTKRARRQPAQKVVNAAGEVEVQPPSNWENVYESVREMRKNVIAPVDTMGCETLAEKNISPRNKRFQTLIALMLSSQTKDTTNAIAIRRLQTELPPPGLTLENILEVDPVRLNEMIYVVGFHNNKTRYIKATALILKEKFANDIPDTIEGLISLPGVGPKMAYLCLSSAWGRTEGIGVDVHVHRITNLWRWHKTKTPEETRAALEVWLPREKWHEINHLLVGFGQTICLPVGRKCGDCTLKSQNLCPSALVERKRVVKKAKKEVVVKDEGADLGVLETETSIKVEKVFQ